MRERVISLTWFANLIFISWNIFLYYRGCYDILQNLCKTRNLEVPDRAYQPVESLEQTAFKHTCDILNFFSKNTECLWNHHLQFAPDKLTNVTKLSIFNLYGGLGYTSGFTKIWPKFLMKVYEKYFPHNLLFIPCRIFSNKRLRRWLNF